MAQNEGTAFARLFSQRRSELDLSVVDIAVRTGHPIEVVVAWDRGGAVPDTAEIPLVAETLRLPKPLVKEAVRRVSEYRQGMPALDLPTEAGTFPAAESEDGESAPTDRASGTPSRTSLGQARAMVTVALDTLGHMFAELRQSVGRRRRAARAPVDQPSYMEDREQLVTYRLRMVFTVAGGIALTLILRWSFTGLGSAISDLWNTLSAAL